MESLEGSYSEFGVNVPEKPESEAENIVDDSIESNSIDMEDLDDNESSKQSSEESSDGIGDDEELDNHIDRLATKMVVEIAEKAGAVVEEDIASELKTSVMSRLRCILMVALQYSHHDNSPGLTSRNFENAEEAVLESSGTRKKYSPRNESETMINLFKTVESEKFSDIPYENLNPRFKVHYPNNFLYVQTEDDEQCEDCFKKNAREFKESDQLVITEEDLKCISSDEGVEYDDPGGEFEEEASSAQNSDGNSEEEEIEEFGSISNYNAITSKQDLETNECEFENEYVDDDTQSKYARYNEECEPPVDYFSKTSTESSEMSQGNLPDNALSERKYYKVNDEEYTIDETLSDNLTQQLTAADLSENATNRYLVHEYVDEDGNSYLVTQDSTIENSEGYISSEFITEQKQECELQNEQRIYEYSEEHVNTETQDGYCSAVPVEEENINQEHISDAALKSGDPKPIDDEVMEINNLDKDTHIEEVELESSDDEIEILNTEDEIEFEGSDQEIELENSEEEGDPPDVDFSDEEGTLEDSKKVEWKDKEEITLDDPEKIDWANEEEIAFEDPESIDWANEKEVEVRIADYDNLQDNQNTEFAAKYLEKDISLKVLDEIELGVSNEMDLENFEVELSSEKEESISSESDSDSVENKETIEYVRVDVTLEDDENIDTYQNFDYHEYQANEIIFEEISDDPQITELHLKKLADDAQNDWNIEENFEFNSRNDVESKHQGNIYPTEDNFQEADVKGDEWHDDIDISNSYEWLEEQAQFKKYSKPNHIKCERVCVTEMPDVDVEFNFNGLTESNELKNKSLQLEYPNTEIELVESENEVVLSDSDIDEELREDSSENEFDDTKLKNCPEAPDDSISGSSEVEYEESESGSDADNKLATKTSEELSLDDNVPTKLNNYVQYQDIISFENQTKTAEYQIDYETVKLDIDNISLEKITVKKFPVKVWNKGVEVSKALLPGNIFGEEDVDGKPVVVPVDALVETTVEENKSQIPVNVLDNKIDDNENRPLTPVPVLNENVENTSHVPVDVLDENKSLFPVNNANKSLEDKPLVAAAVLEQKLENIAVVPKVFDEKLEIESLIQIEALDKTKLEVLRVMEISDAAKPLDKQSTLHTIANTVKVRKPKKLPKFSLKSIEDCDAIIDSFNNCVPELNNLYVIEFEEMVANDILDDAVKAQDVCLTFDENNATVAVDLSHDDMLQFENPTDATIVSESCDDIILSEATDETETKPSQHTLKTEDATRGEDKNRGIEFKENAEEQGVVMVQLYSDDESIPEEDETVESVEYQTDKNIKLCTYRQDDSNVIAEPCTTFDDDNDFHEQPEDSEDACNLEQPEYEDNQMVVNDSDIEFQNREVLESELITEPLSESDISDLIDQGMGNYEFNPFEENSSDSDFLRSLCSGEAYGTDIINPFEVNPEEDALRRNEEKQVSKLLEITSERLESSSSSSGSYTDQSASEDDQEENFTDEEESQSRRPEVFDLLSQFPVLPIEWKDYMKVFVTNFFRNTDTVHGEIDTGEFDVILGDIRKHGAFPVLDIICDLFHDYILKNSVLLECGKVLPASVETHLNMISATMKAVLDCPLDCSRLHFKLISSVLIDLLTFPTPCKDQQRLIQSFLQVIQRYDELLDWTKEYITETLKQMVDIPLEELTEDHKSLLGAAIGLANGLETIDIHLAHECSWQKSLLVFCQKYYVLMSQPGIYKGFSENDSYIENSIFIFFKEFCTQYSRLPNVYKFRLQSIVNEVYGERMTMYLKVTEEVAALARKRIFKESLSKKKGSHSSTCTVCCKVDKSKLNGKSFSKNSNRNGVKKKHKDSNIVSLGLVL